MGILGLSPSDLKKKCNRHVEEMISSPQYPKKTTADDLSGLLKQILETVCKYISANKDVSVPAKC
jgi:hypothetical protein